MRRRDKSASKKKIELDDAFRSFITLVANTRPDRRVIAIGNHFYLDALVAPVAFIRRRELDVLFPAPVLVAFGVEDEHGRRAGLQVMRGRRSGRPARHRVGPTTEPYVRVFPHIL